MVTARRHITGSDHCLFAVTNIAGGLWPLHRLINFVGSRKFGFDEG